MEIIVKCKKCGYGSKTYEGTEEIRKISIELNWFELLPLNGTTEVLRPCPNEKCDAEKLVKV